jgi:hypothetical protein
MSGPVGLGASWIQNVEEWLISHWAKWPSYLRAGGWAIVGGLLAKFVL